MQDRDWFNRIRWNKLNINDEVIKSPLRHPSSATFKASLTENYKKRKLWENSQNVLKCLHGFLVFLWSAWIWNMFKRNLKMCVKTESLQVSETHLCSFGFSLLQESLQWAKSRDMFNNCFTQDFFPDLHPQDFLTKARTCRSEAPYTPCIWIFLNTQDQQTL